MSFLFTVYVTRLTSYVHQVERYTYTYDQNTQELDHLFISNALKARGADVQHIHVNTWSPTYASRISDHDPSVARLLVCTNLQKFTGARTPHFSILVARRFIDMYVAVGGIAPAPVTQRRGRYYTNGTGYLLRATARTASCNGQVTACSSYAKKHSDVTLLECSAQLVNCLAKVLF
jgi:hypothetical protein